jgi:hypothetical protein
VRVWEGDLTNENQALQLLVIVDYMADWARDYYREAVKMGLENFAEDCGLGLERVDTHIISRGNTRDSYTDMNSACGEQGIGEYQIQCSANDRISASIAEDPFPGGLFGNEIMPPFTEPLSLSNAFSHSGNVQMQQQLQLQQPVGDSFLPSGMPNQGIFQSLPEPPSPTHNTSLALGNLFLPEDIPYPGPSQVAPEPLPSSYSDHLYQPVGTSYLGVPQSLYPPQPLPFVNCLFPPGGNPFPRAPQIAQQPQPSYTGDQFPSASNQYFEASPAVQQPQPQTYYTTGPQLDVPVQIGPIRTQRGGINEDKKAISERE